MLNEKLQMALWRVLDESPIILRSSAYFELHSFYIFRVFSLRLLLGGVFSRRPILIHSNRFSVILQLYYALSKKLRYVLNFRKEKT